MTTFLRFHINHNHFTFQLFYDTRRENPSGQMMCRGQAVRTPKRSPWERENKFVCSWKGCNDLYSSLSAGSSLNIREMIGKARFSANWFYVDYVNLQLKAKHYSAPEAAGVSSFQQMDETDRTDFLG